MGLINSIFGTYSARQVKKIMPIVNAIENLAEKYAAMSDAQLKAQTDLLQRPLAKGETLDDICPTSLP